jgi:hypothetical protein
MTRGESMHRVFKSRSVLLKGGLASLVSLVIVILMTRVDPTPGWRERLYTPTYVTKLGQYYFIVDCWHHRILYKHHFDPDLRTWKTLDDDLRAPHSIAWDGANYVVDDTNAHKLRVYRKARGGLRLANTVDDVGRRPHRVRFDEVARAYYIIGSNSQDFFVLSLGPGGAVEHKTRIKLDFLNGCYTRSFTLHEGFIYFVSANGFIYKTLLNNGAFSVMQRYSVPARAQNLNDLWFGKGKIYITATPRVILEADSLEALDRGRFSDIYERNHFKGTPYFISEIDDSVYIPEIIESSGLLRFRPGPDGGLELKSHVLDFGPPNGADLKRFAAYPM